MLELPITLYFNVWPRKTCPSKTDKFAESSEAVGGSFLIQKSILQIVLRIYLNAQMLMCPQKIGRRGSKGAWNFSPNSSVLVPSPVPYNNPSRRLHSRDQVLTLKRHCKIQQKSFFWDILVLSDSLTRQDFDQTWVR